MLHDPDKFGTLFELIEHESNGNCLSNNEPNEMANCGVKNTLKGERGVIKIQVNAMIEILMRNGLQLETMNFANNTPFDFLVESKFRPADIERKHRRTLIK